MKKTCFNCKYYHGELCDPEKPDYHMHNWCGYWNAFIPQYGKTDKFDYQVPYYDDLETGEAFCWMFEAKDAPAFEDEWFERNAHENRRNRIVEED